MTYHSRQWSAIDAVINAGRDVPPQIYTADQRPTLGRSERAASECADPRATMVLSRILDATPASTKPCIQFVACGQGMSALGVAVAASRVATTLLGPSLMLYNHMSNDSGEEIEPRTCETVPDAFVHGLCHYNMARSASDLDPLFGRSQRGETLTALLAPFHFVAIDSCAPWKGPAYNALAAICTGTVLVVRAGESNRSTIKEVALDVTRAGGRIIGLVLDEAPPKLPSWIRRP